MQRSQVFISYSHADAEYLGRLKVHMRPFERQGHVDLWADSRITPGDRWKQEIASAMERASIAVLLVSADFLASDFVAENELPPLLEAAQREGVRIVPVILKPCAFSDIPSLAQFQSVNDPRKPLASLAENDREQVWYDLAVTVRQQLQRVAEAAAVERLEAKEYAPPHVSLDIGFRLFASTWMNSRSCHWLQMSWPITRDSVRLSRRSSIGWVQKAGKAMAKSVYSGFRPSSVRAWRTRGASARGSSNSRTTEPPGSLRQLPYPSRGYLGSSTPNPIKRDALKRAPC